MKSKILITTLIATFLFVPAITSARFFNPNDIFTDKELFDDNALSKTAIQRFLESKNSVLASVTAVINGVPKLVSEMIYEIGKEYGISQKFLLAKLQQEQGLIEKSEVREKALDWATGYSCFNRRCNEKYRGIYAQLDAAADTQRIYSEKGKGYFGFSLGEPGRTADGYTVTPINQATTNLYIYTPYQGSERGIGGNFFFWRVWNQYFTERIFPDGALLKNENTNTFWKIQENKRRKFVTDEIYLKDYTIGSAIPVSFERLSYYEIGEPITMSNNAVVKGANSGLTYLISDGFKHRIVGAKALASLGYRIAETKPSDPAVISDGELALYKEGEPITEQSVYPQGILVIDNAGAIFLIKHGIRHVLLDEAVWQENFNREVPINVSAETLELYSPGEPIQLVDGSIVKSRQGKFFIISNGEKHAVTSEEIIKRVYGIAVFNQIPEASDALLALNETSDNIDYIDDTILDPANYVSYADRVGQSSTSSSTITTTTLKKATYLTLFDTVDVPASVLVGSSVSVAVTFRNRGSVSWQAGKVFLKLIDENSSASSFLAHNRIALAKNTDSNQIAEFVFDIVAPLTAGEIREWFIIEYEDATGAIVEMPGGLVGKNISVISGISAQVVEHNIPIALKNTWKPFNVTFKLKNASTDEVWTARRAAFALQGKNEAESPFYDRYDWLDKKVVGVPINKSRIAPGEEGVIKFTLDPRGVAPGVYKLVFSMELRDVEEQVYLNGRETWERLIRIDP